MRVFGMGSMLGGWYGVDVSWYMYLDAIQCRKAMFSTSQLSSPRVTF